MATGQRAVMHDRPGVGPSRCTPSRHIRDVSAEAPCAGFHKPFPITTCSCPMPPLHRRAARLARVRQGRLWAGPAIWSVAVVIPGLEDLQQRARAGASCIFADKPWVPVNQQNSHVTPGRRFRQPSCRWSLASLRTGWRLPTRPWEGLGVMALPHPAPRASVEVPRVLAFPRLAAWAWADVPRASSVR